eukprot:3144994-Prymnesium_polylepis.1
MQHVRFCTRCDLRNGRYRRTQPVTCSPAIYNTQESVILDQESTPLTDRTSRFGRCGPCGGRVMVVTNCQPTTVPAAAPRPLSGSAVTSRCHHYSATSSCVKTT